MREALAEDWQAIRAAVGPLWLLRRVLDTLLSPAICLRQTSHVLLYGLFGGDVEDITPRWTLTTGLQIDVPGGNAADRMRVRLLTAAAAAGTAWLLVEAAHVPPLAQALGGPQIGLLVADPLLGLVEMARQRASHNHDAEVTADAR
jgi:hypothetical protein